MPAIWPSLIRQSWQANTAMDSHLGKLESPRRSGDEGAHPTRYIAGMEQQNLEKTVYKAEISTRTSRTPEGGHHPEIVTSKRRLTSTNSATRIAYLDGNFTRRNLPHEDQPYELWDTVLAGSGMRVRPSGTRSWFVRVRHRGRYRRISLGRVGMVEAEKARSEA